MEKGKTTSLPEVRTTSKEKKMEALRDREEENDETIQVVMNRETKLETNSWYSTEDIENNEGQVEYQVESGQGCDKIKIYRQPH